MAKLSQIRPARISPAVGSGSLGSGPGLIQPPSPSRPPAADPGPLGPLHLITPADGSARRFALARVSTSLPLVTIRHESTLSSKVCYRWLLGCSEVGRSMQMLLYFSIAIAIW